MAKEKSVFDDLDVKIEKFRPTNEDIKDYIAAQHTVLAGEPKESLSLNQYLKDKYFADSKVVVAADLSDRTFSRADNITDLRSGDFTGCIFKNTAFKGCNLADAVFCDVDFDNAYFEDTILRNIDFRGADLANCRFSGDYKGYSQIGKESDIEGIKFSTTSSLGRKYADIKSDLVRQKEQKDIVKSKTKELNDAYVKLSLKEKSWQAIGYKTNNPEYDRLEEELNLMVEQKIFPRKDNAMHETFQNIFGSESCTFDPAYVRGATKEQRDQETQYVRLAREDIEKYLEARKGEKDLTLNDFAKSKLAQSQIIAGARIIADCSSRVDISTNNEWHDRVDLSGLDFSGADLRGAVFSGSVLSGCKFNGTDISEASFEGAELVAANFVGVKADNANFFNSNLSKSTVTDKSQFVHAFMSRSNGQEVVISDCNFDYANIKNGNWDHAKFTDSTFNQANLEGISLISADLRKVQMQHAILDKAILTECKVIDSDLSNALMQGAKAHKVQFKNTVLENIEAKGIDLSEAELDSLTKLEGANLAAAILTRIKAEGVSFVGANLNMVEASRANFKNAILENVDIKFANLTEAVLEGAKAHGINASYSILKKVHAQRADFSDSIMRRIEAQQADFTEVNFTNSDLTRSKLQQAILEKVQAEKVRLEGVSLRAAKLAEARMSKATIDADTDIVGGDLIGLKGKFIQNGQEIVPQELQNKQTALEKAELQLMVDALPSMAVGFLKETGALFLDVVTALSSTARSLPDIKDLYANFLKFQEVGSKLSSSKLLVEEKQKLQTEQVEHASNLIKGAGVVLERYIPDLNGTQSDFLEEIIAKYSVLPILSTVLKSAPSGGVSPGIFNGVDKNFIRGMVPLTLNLANGVLAGESNKKIQKIYKNLVISNEKSGRKIIKNALEIFVSPKVAEVVKKDLVEFLRNPVNQKEISKIAGNVLDDRFTRFVSKEFFDDTVQFAINATGTILDHTPKVVVIYESYMKHQDIALELLTDKNLSSTRREEIIETQKAMVSSILGNIDQVVQSLSPALKQTLPKYFADNKENILGFLDKPEVQQNIRSYGLNPKFVHDATAATIPFIVDVLPIVTELTESCLKDKEGLGRIIEQTKDIMNVPKSEQAEKVSKLVDSLIKFNKDNPKVKEVLQKEIPNLLIKHAKDLGSVVEKFLNETEMGKKLKLKGEVVVKVLGDHTQELGAITASYSKGEYGAMVRPLIGLLSDKKVLTLAVGATANILKHNFQKHFVSNATRGKAIGEEMSQIIGDILPNLKPDEKRDLSSIFQERAYEYSKGSHPAQYSPILDYSLSNKDLRGLSFETVDMKLDNFEVKGFNFNKVTLGKCSIKDAVFKECSFKGAVFKEHINFEGATIDGSTLTTLLPEIKKYNKKHPEKTMNLDKIKVVGHIKEEVKANPLLKNADLTKATVKKIEVAPPVSVPKPGQTILIEQSKRKHSGSLAK
ncbi:pentapeptide repeat-containing protein [Candidatus Tisiphia endosymbiont of Hybos culiciformis]|uniref:pentapeptide repeat-containing protein n=1 Tax=Candidatus Tisiphia endosymbiont of Hybos culiciformis TaxID=3139331 RepID=UPI003CCB3499